MAGIDVSAARDTNEKALHLRGELLTDLTLILQAEQLNGADARVVFDCFTGQKLLKEFASDNQGLSTGDNPRFRRSFWEVLTLGGAWEPEQSSVEGQMPYGGRSGILLWEGGRGQLWQFGRDNVETLHNVERRGEESWGKRGVVISQMHELPATLYGGEKFDTNAAVLVPRNPEHLSALWAFCSCAEYSAAVRRIDQSLKVTSSALVKVPFDLATGKRWPQRNTLMGCPSRRAMIQRNGSSTAGRSNPRHRFRWQWRGSWAIGGRRNSKALTLTLSQREREPECGSAPGRGSWCKPATRSSRWPTRTGLSASLPSRRTAGR